MRPKKYPLDPLARLRAARLDGAARALGEAARAREAAERKAAAQKAAHAQAEDAARTAEAGEATALDRGELRVADVVRGEAWRARVTEDLGSRARRVAVAEEAEQGARAAEVEAQRTLADRDADAKLVEKDRARWAAHERKHADARDEEASAEGWRPKGS
jgi:hypothetical protein